MSLVWFTIHACQSHDTSSCHIDFFEAMQEQQDYKQHLQPSPLNWNCLLSCSSLAVSYIWKIQKISKGIRLLFQANQDIPWRMPSIGFKSPACCCKDLLSLFFLFLWPNIRRKPVIGIPGGWQKRIEINKNMIPNSVDGRLFPRKIEQTERF